jgi:hypothetical protein
MSSVQTVRAMRHTADSRITDMLQFHSPTIFGFHLVTLSSTEAGLHRHYCFQIHTVSHEIPDTRTQYHNDIIVRLSRENCLLAMTSVCEATKWLTVPRNAKTPKGITQHIRPGVHKGARSSRRLNFERCRLKSVGPQNRTCLMLPFRHL